MTVDDFRAGVLLCLGLIVVSIAIYKNKDNLW